MMDFYDAGIVFGSCNRQNLPQRHWLDLREKRTRRFLWLGDAVYGYPSGNNVGGLRRAFLELFGDLENCSSRNNNRGSSSDSTTCPPYVDFLFNRSVSSNNSSSNHQRSGDVDSGTDSSGNSSSPSFSSVTMAVDVDGVWDDHDMGINDGGKFAPSLLERKALFSEFILNKNLAIDMEANSFELYKTRVFKVPVQSMNQNGATESASTVVEKIANVRVIFLDTRSYRDAHFIPGIGEFERVPYTAYGAAITRCISSYMGLVDRYHHGDILGEEQWRWLESILLMQPDLESNETKYDFNIIVSSIQVLTTNCIVESWGHFPASKKKLMDLISRSTLKGIVLLSGDVHHGEISGGGDEAAVYTIFDQKLERGSVTNDVDTVVEITSSGMTHSCSNCNTSTNDCPLNGPSLCKNMLDLFHKHRTRPNSYYTLPNYGYMFVRSNNAGSAGGESLILNVSVLDISSHKIVLSSEIKSLPPNKLSRNYRGFPTFWGSNNDDTIPQLNIAIYSSIILLFVTIFYFSFRLRRRYQRQTQLPQPLPN